MDFYCEKFKCYNYDLLHGTCSLGMKRLPGQVCNKLNRRSEEMSEAWKPTQSKMDYSVILSKLQGTNTSTQATEEIDMKYTQETLFVVTMVSAKDRSILLDELIVAPTPEDAKFRVGVDLKLRDKGLEPKDVTIFVNVMGSVKVEDN